MNRQPPSEAAVPSPCFTQTAIASDLATMGWTPEHDHHVQAVKDWALARGYSWDEDHGLPEPKCGGCGSPINVWDGEDACPDCNDCEECCWDNHGGEPHSVMARRYETDLPWNRGA